MADRREIERILNELAGRQAGMVTRDQLRASGLSTGTIARLLNARRLVRVHRGVYRVTPMSMPRSEEHAALLAAGPRSRISHRSAAHLMQLAENTAPPTLEITVARGMGCRLSGVRVHRIRGFRDDESTMIDGLRVTTPARTLLDIAGCEPRRTVEQGYATALRRRLVTAETMRDMVESHPTHRGGALLRRLTADGDPAFARSKAEEKLLAIVVSAGLPRPRMNVKVSGHEVDLLWETQRVVAEVDGYVFHASSDAFAADRRRDAELTAAGYRVLRFTWEDLSRRRLRTIVRLAQALVR